MAEWVSHLIVADRVLERIPQLSRREFCVGNIAPDCNLPNADGTDFIPPRAVTHWMQSGRKMASDAERFFSEYILAGWNAIGSREELSFLLGYYAHLLTDAELQRILRDEKRVADVWKRVKAVPELRERAEGIQETWDGFKLLMPDRRERMKGFTILEREYLDSHPDSGYFQEIRNTVEFPDYLDYLPKGAIPAKIRMMYYMPDADEDPYSFIGFSREECSDFLERAAEIVTKEIEGSAVVPAFLNRESRDTDLTRENTGDGV